MTNADLRIKEEIEVDPIEQNRNQEKNLLTAKSSRCWLATPGEVSEQCHQEYDLRGNRYLEEGRVKVIPGEAMKRPVVMIYSKLPSHVNVSKGLSHPLLELNQIQAFDVRHWQWKRQVADDRGSLEFFEKWIFERIPRQRRSNSIEAEPQINCHDTHRGEEHDRH